MAPYQVTIAYDGTDFFGNQRQKNHRTVQGEIENTLRILGWTGQTIYSSGRTDRGVHAEGQVISFDLDWKHKEAELRSALNNFLPSDISALEVKIAVTGFHPRFSAKERQYRYQVVFMPVRHPILDRYYWRVWPKPDEKCLKESVDKIIGKHDFLSLGRPPKKGGLTSRTVTTCEWHLVEEDKAFLRIKAESFLYHMVRRTVFLLVQIGQGKLNAIDLEESLIGKKELPAGIAPSQGLFLEKVIY
jgi:tRNA pseudouridine38-40 synthase